MYLKYRDKKQADFHPPVFYLLWCLQELNRGHMDFQSIALPPELRHHGISCKTRMQR